MPTYRSPITQLSRLSYPRGCFILNGGALATMVRARVAADGTIMSTSEEIQAPPGAHLHAVAAGGAAAWSSGTTMWVRPPGRQDTIKMFVPELDEPGIRVALLSAGTRLVTASITAIRMYDVESAELNAVADMPNAYTRNGLDRMWGTHDGRLVTSKYASQLIWDTNLQVLTSPDSFGLTGHYVCHVNAVDHDSTYFAACTMPRNIAVIDTRQNVLHANLPIPEGDNGEHIASDIDFHPDHGNLFVAVQPGGAIIGCDTSSGTTEILATDRRRWTHCFFSGPDVFVTIDDVLQCTIWQVTL